MSAAPPLLPAHFVVACLLCPSCAGALPLRFLHPSTCHALLRSAGSGFDLSGPESLLQAVGVLAATVAVHEAGHFIAARSQNIHVNKFAIGFGPIILQFKVGARAAGLFIVARRWAAEGLFKGGQRRWCFVLQDGQCGAVRTWWAAGML